ncbi:RNA methyltransferase [Saprospiraceae bacterium]|nr:RNA methyltransferase [Saprospiraceae bacterium]HCV49830.1 RNA methyltransferase [Saprospirales bacterium]MDA9332882.1 RNA methyltransferase [Saprospiraceae bacterium]MDB4162688.1 RNA methyltransferase [Saprospiraceae bacterium]MDB4824618.1 RNA methyltransferase [Saprospiraceae bacterium]
MRKLKLQELNRLDVEGYKASAKVSVVVILDNIRSAINVGSVFRSSDAFAIERIILVGFTATPPSREITKTAIGATSSVDWTHVDDITDTLLQLKRNGYTITSIEQTDSSVSLLDWDIKPDQKLAIVMGNEVDGVSDEALALSDVAIEIPQYGTKHSLNVSVCTGVVLWEVSRKLRS